MTRDDEDLSYPLHWPLGRPRTQAGKRGQAKFRNSGGYDSYARRVSLTVGRDRVLDELARLGARELVISTNMAGLSRSEPPDPGVAVYFELPSGLNGTRGLGGVKHCLACDRWDRVADNLAAIAAHVSAMRGQLRWGVGDVAQAFAGYRALSEAGAKVPWWQVMGIRTAEAAARLTTDKLREIRIEMLQRLHPDKGGTEADANRAAEVNAAFDEAMQERGGTP